MSTRLALGRSLFLCVGNQPAGSAEAAFFGNPTFRIRHYLPRLDTPYVDILIGQWWQLYGWQPIYFPTPCRSRA
jgi:hypothetical protein